MSDFVDAVLRCDTEATRTELSAGANVHEVDADMTPLLWAIMQGNLDAVKLLLESGADPNLTPKLSGSPLWSAEDDFGLFAIVDLLKAHGAKK